MAKDTTTSRALQKMGFKGFDDQIKALIAMNLFRKAVNDRLKQEKDYRETEDDDDYFPCSSDPCEDYGPGGYSPVD